VTLEIQTALTVGMPTLAVLISIDLEGTLRSDFRHLEERLR